MKLRFHHVSEAPSFLAPSSSLTVEEHLARQRTTRETLNKQDSGMTPDVSSVRNSTPLISHPQSTAHDSFLRQTSWMQDRLYVCLLGQSRGYKLSIKSSHLEPVQSLLSQRPSLVEHQHPSRKVSPQDVEVRGDGVRSAAKVHVVGEVDDVIAELLGDVHLSSHKRARLTLGNIGTFLHSLTYLTTFHSPFNQRQ